MSNGSMSTAPQWTNGGQQLNCSSSASNYFAQVLPLFLNRRVCGTANTNTTALAACCDVAPVENYLCNSYCITDVSITEMSRCYMREANVTSLGPGELFCQSNTAGSIKESTSWATPRIDSPKISLLLFALLFATFFVSPSLAGVIESLDNGLTRRQSGSSNCSLDIHNSYTSILATQKLSPTFGFGNPTPVSNITAAFNRTLSTNVTAAAPAFDAFFEQIASQTGHRFPASANFSMVFEWTKDMSSNAFVGFTPRVWCANMTVTRCPEIGRDDTTVQACGPMFFSDAVYVNNPNGTRGPYQVAEALRDVPQGDIGIVTTA